MSSYDQMVKDAIVAHYSKQYGSGASSYPVFRGSSVQYGNGIGDIFKSIGRFLLPIFASSAKTFVQSAAQGMSEGHSLKDAAKQALKPTMTSTVQDAGERIFKRFVGAGKGKKKKRKPSPLYKGKANKKPRTEIKSNFIPLNF